MGFACLVRLRCSNVKHQSLFVRFKMLDIDAGELGAAECSDEPDEQQRLVS